MSPAKAARKPSRKVAKTSAKNAAKKAAPKAAKAAKKAKPSAPAKRATTPSKTASKAAPKFGTRSGVGGKGEGAAAIAAWIAGINPAHRGIAQRYDALVGDVLPGVQRAVKWSAPFYGLPGQGWVTTFASFKGHASIGFFAGTQLKPMPPEGESGSMRRVNLRDDADFDERQLRAWLQQAATLQGWGKV